MPDSVAVNDSAPLDHAIQGLRLQIQQAVYGQFNGSLVFSISEQERYWLTFRLGRIVWASGGAHRFRRWHRLLGQYCPTVARQVRRLQALQPSPTWEYQVLIRLLAQGRIERSQAVSLITAAIEEVLFDLLLRFAALGQVSQKSGEMHLIEQPIVIPVVGELLSATQQQLAAWHGAQLTAYHPDLSPALHHPEQLKEKLAFKTYQALLNLLKGQSTLRELSRLLPQSLLQLSQMLVAYEQQGLVSFHRLPDFPPPWPLPPARAVAKPGPQVPLIFCVDDNPLVGRTLGHLVQQQGYRYTCVQDSVKALQEIIEQKPALIFVDLVMPVISGYELCSQLRRIAQFRAIPLIILTGNDGVVDRLRSKMVGATAFLTKPITPEKTATVLQQYLPQPQLSPETSVA